MSDSLNNNDDSQPNDVVVDDESLTKEVIFETLSPESTDVKKQDINLIFDIPVNLSVELGRTKMAIKDLLNLTQGSVISLDGLAGEPLDILINDRSNYNRQCTDILV